MAIFGLEGRLAEDRVLAQVSVGDPMSLAPF